jgi:hypothetical protein
MDCEKIKSRVLLVSDGVDLHWVVSGERGKSNDECEDGECILDSDLRARDFLESRGFCFCLFQVRFLRCSLLPSLIPLPASPFPTCLRQSLSIFPDSFLPTVHC